MILDRLDIGADAFVAGTGWAIKPEGACKGEICVPLMRDRGFDLVDTAQRLGMALVHDAAHGVWALGPESLTGRTLVSAAAPDVVLQDMDGNDFHTAALHGQKFVIVSWAPY
ncbi:MAG: hypothetical protein ABIR68_09330 [Ilumatobacteraceae bacterium]